MHCCFAFVRTGSMALALGLRMVSQDFGGSVLWQLRLVPQPLEGEHEHVKAVRPCPLLIVRDAVQAQVHEQLAHLAAAARRKDAHGRVAVVGVDQRFVLAC